MIMQALQIALVNREPGWYYDEYLDRPIYWDGEQWYYYIAGAYYPLATRWEVAPYVVSLTQGETLRITVSFYYQGPAFSGFLYGAIGEKGVWNPVTGTYAFNEAIHGTTSLVLSSFATPTLVSNRNIDIPITTALAAGKDYSIYAKVQNGITPTVDTTMSPYYENAIHITGIEIDFTNFEITSYGKA